MADDVAVKTALVTGASGGIGRQLAIALAKEGWTITAVARRKDALEALMGELSGDGHRLLVADLGDPTGVAAVQADLTAGGYQLLVNNAGTGLNEGKGFHHTPWERLATMMRLNVDALLALSHTFLTGAKRGDALMNVASTLGLLAFPAQATYTATKAFVRAFSENVWFQYEPKGVYVFALCPGATHTEFFANAAEQGKAAEKPPAGVMQTPDAVVRAALKALRQRKNPVVLTGGKNPMFVFFARLLSRKGLVKMMGGMG